MSYFSEYCREELLKATFGLSTFPKPHLYVGLGLANYSNIVEPTATDYNRIPFDKWKIETRRVKNDRAITLYTRSSWGQIGYMCLWDNVVGGNLIAIIPITPTTVGSGAVISLKKNQLILDVAAGTITDYLANMYLQHVFGSDYLETFEAIIGLSYTEPNDQGYNVHEPTNPDYYALTYEDWDVTNCALVNTTVLSYPRPAVGTTWGSIPYAFVKDNKDMVLLYGGFSQSMDVDHDNPAVIQAGALSFIFD